MQSNNSQPFFCIVIPTYNRAEMLVKTIQNILLQSFTDYVVHIIDDGSTDDTQSMLNNKIKDQTKLKYFFKDHQERGAARNFGFKQADSKYVLFFDSDDHMHPDHLEVLHANILEYNYPEFISTQFDFINEQGKHFTSDSLKLNQGYYDYKLFLNGNPIGCNVCVKRDLKDLILFPEDPVFSSKEDWLFFLLNMKKYRLLLIEKVTISLLDHPMRSMKQDGAGRIKRSFLAADWIQQQIQLTDTEKSEMMAHINYFSSIHAYLDGNRKVAFHYLNAAIRIKGLLKKYAILFIKILIGRRIILMIHG